MNNMIRFWNQNRKGIIASVIVIVFLIVIVQILNEITKKQMNEKQEKTENLRIEEMNLPSRSIITGEKVSIEATKTNTSLIKEFVNMCNNKEIDNAYELLTDDCKEANFPTKQLFIENYYNLIFLNKQNFDIENYYNDSEIYTYKIKYYVDSLSTGNISNNSYTDYITVNEMSNKGKLNISNFIKKEKIDSYEEKDGIKITVVSKNIYLNYEKYNVIVENKTGKEIMINTNEKRETINIQTQNGIKYGANMTDISNNLLKIEPYMSRNYIMRFNKNYNPDIDIDSVNFEDIVSDYNRDIYTPEDKERIKIKINI